MKQRGFSLIELMIVVVVIGILAAIAIPAVSNNALKARRAIAKSEMMEVQSKQEEYFINNKAYTTNLADLGYVSPLYIDDDANSVAQANSFYQITIVAATLNYTITAAPTNAQLKDVECGTLTLANTGAKGASGTRASGCW